MSTFKRILISITRRKGTIFALFLVMFILGTAISMSTSIYQSAKRSQKSILENIPLITSIHIDYSKVGDSHDTYEPLSYEYAEELASFEGIKYMNFEQKEDFVMELNMIDNPGNHTYKGYNRVPVSIITYPEIMEIEQGQFRLLEGNTFSEDPLGFLVSESIAKLNDLHVGKMVGVKLFQNIPGEDDLVEGGFLAEVIGIYEDPVNFDGNVVYLTREYYHQIGPGLFPWKIETDDIIRGNEEISAHFVLEDPRDSEAFYEYLKETIPDYYQIDASVKLYEKMVGPLSIIEKMSGLILGVIVLSSILILTGAVFMFAHQKRYEIGIYRVMGESRFHIISMIFVEFILIASISLTLALFTGYGMSKMVSLDPSNPELEDTESSVIQTDIDIQDSYRIVLSKEYIAAYYATAFGITGISLFVSLIYITQIKPQELLM